VVRKGGRRRNRIEEKMCICTCTFPCYLLYSSLGGDEVICCDDSKTRGIMRIRFHDAYYLRQGMSRRVREEVLLDVFEFRFMIRWI
jgi:hypothetical protein